MLGKEISGATAAEWGIIHAAAAEDQLDTAATELVTQLGDAPTVALGLTKWLLQSGNGLDLDRHLQNEAMALELSSRSEDFREGLAAFRDKRDANSRVVENAHDSAADHRSHERRRRRRDGRAMGRRRGARLLADGRRREPRCAAGGAQRR